MRCDRGKKKEHTSGIPILVECIIFQHRIGVLMKWLGFNKRCQGTAAKHSASLQMMHIVGHT